MRKNQAGFGAFGIILLLLLTAVVGYAGWHVYESGLQDDADSQAERTSVPSKPKVVQKTETEATNGQLAYRNDTLGISFSYPAAWGKEPEVKDVFAGAKQYEGKVYKFIFSGQRLVLAGVMARDYDPLGADGGCFVQLGILPSNTAVKNAAASQTGPFIDDTYNAATYKGTTRKLAAPAGTILTEGFAAGDSEGPGTCLGPNMRGSKAFPDDSRFTGIQFFWGDDTLQSLPIAQFESFKANPDAFISVSDRQAFASTLESAKSL